MGYDVVRSEYTYGKSRFDFYMEHGGKRHLTEVKGCTLTADSSCLAENSFFQHFVTEEKKTVLCPDTRNLYTSSRVRSSNEKGYYIVDAINDAINAKKKIAFLYTDYNEKSSSFFETAGSPIQSARILCSGMAIYTTSLATTMKKTE